MSGSQDQLVDLNFDKNPNDFPNEVEVLVSAEKPYLAQGQNFVSFPAGAYMRVVNNSRTDFWKVEMKGAVGWIPTQIVVVVQDLSATEIADKLKSCKNNGSPEVINYRTSRFRSLSKPKPVDPRSRSASASRDNHPSLPLKSNDETSGPMIAEVPGFPDWRAVDTGDGKIYYYNTNTNETSWYPPGTQSAENQQLNADQIQKLYDEKIAEMQRLESEMNKFKGN